MAQLIITIIDSENGSLSSVFKLKDKDVARIYRVYKTKFAESIINDKIQKSEVLEASDTVENIINDIESQEVLNNIANKIVNDIISIVHNIESDIAYQKIANQVDYIKIVGED